MILLILPLISIYIACGIILLCSLLYSANMAFKIYLILYGLKIEQEKNEIDLHDNEFPFYSILVPMFREEKLVKQILQAILNLDYSIEKLDVKFIVEEDDLKTINAFIDCKLPENFEIIKVPYSLPQTKPKACNYALRFAIGEYITIYDADDIPDTLQLKKALQAFKSSNSDLACVQARLNYYNRDYNLLTKMISIEYTNLFDLVLPALSKLNAPIPLGGTSNHFSMHILRELGGWDSYNVAEDADLGIRLHKSGYKVTMIDSITLEEAPISAWAWIKQRSRWIKGYFQTYFIHMDYIINLYKNIGLFSFISFQFLLGISSFIFIISPIMWLYSALIFIPYLNSPSFIQHIAYLTLFIGYFAQFAIAAISLHISNNLNNNMKLLTFFPFYFILHSVAGFRALWHLFKIPYHWEKTEHAVGS